MSKKLKPLVKNGHHIAVLRPLDPKKVVEEAKRVMRDVETGKLSNDEAQAAINKVGTDQERTLVGLAAPDEESKVCFLLDPLTLKVIEGEQVEPGDIFVSYEELVASETEHQS